MAFFFRNVLTFKFCIHRGKSPTETYKMLKHVCGGHKHSIGIDALQKVEDDECSRWPVTACMSESTSKVMVIICTNIQQMIEQMAKAVGMLKTMYQ